jgi:hypothetical protein
MAVTSRVETDEACVRKVYRTKRRNLGWVIVGFVRTIRRALSISFTGENRNKTLRNTVCRAHFLRRRVHRSAQHPPLNSHGTNSIKIRLSKMFPRNQLVRTCPSNWRHTRSFATVDGSNQDTTGSADPTGYCKDLVRKHDYESFLTSQFYPKEMQGGYFALKAFYVSV